ncbi:MAG TPA: hypothetical protein VHL78_01090 [Actinomycetota bacterium]|nr:hypothetical protein [Actinomycetota bacterium]
MGVRRVLVVVVVSGAAVALSAGPSWACTCVQYSPERHAKLADVIVAGRIDALTEGPQIDVAHLTVTDVYKGPRTGGWTVETAADGPACGYEFVEGRRYTVFGSVDDGTLKGTLHTSLCTATTAGDIDPHVFGLDPAVRLRKPPPPAPAPGEEDAATQWPWAAVAGGAVAGGLAALIAVRRTRRPKTLT